MDYGADGYGIAAILVSYDHGLLGYTTYSHDGYVGLIDDGEAEDGAELAGIGDGEGGTFDVGGHELLSAGALTEIGDAALEAEEVQLVGVLEDGDDQSPV